MTSQKNSPLVVFWFRRDLRLEDNAGLYHALKSGYTVLPLFIFDKDILERLEDRDDARVGFIHDAVEALHEELRKHKSGLLVKHGRPLDVWQELLKEYDIHAVYTNHDYEPYAKERDGAVRSLLEKQGKKLHTYKDQVIFDRKEVVKDNGEPYYVYTPYSKRWKQKLNSFYLKPYPTASYFRHLLEWRSPARPSLKEIGFERSAIEIPSSHVARRIIENYGKTRDYPWKNNGTTRLGLHLRFGTISVRRLATIAAELNDTYLNELIWREFFMCILDHHPEVAEQSFHKEYDRIEWRNNEKEFELWCQGKTGFPIVDAGMRELNATGYMHNRVRMVVANFLTRMLLTDWRWGEQYFARKLLDYELASNNGNWQWCAGTGVDAAPYFRIFNPQAQQEKFDKELKYIRQYVPEYGTKDYPRPIVEYKEARERALKVYKAVKG